MKPKKNAVVLAGPVPDGVTVRRVTMPRHFIEVLDPKRDGAPGFSLELSDGRGWTTGTRPCTRFERGAANNAYCMISELALPGGGMHRRVVASFHDAWSGWDQETVCSEMSDPPPISRRAR